MTSNDINSFANSKSYIIQATSQFDYSFYFHNFCNGLEREQVRDKFNIDLQDAVFDFDAFDASTTKWIEEQIKYNLPILETQEIDEFWLLRQEKKQYYNEGLRKFSFGQSIHKAHERSVASSNMSREIANYNVVEGDNLIFFNGRSICSILKSHGKKLFQRYNKLSDEEQAVCGLCVNGILDLSNRNESSQKYIFTNDQWNYLEKRLRSKKAKHLPKLDSNTKEKVNEIISKIKSKEEEESYYLALESVRGAHPNDKWIFKVLAHIINAYRERSYIFTNPMNKVSELDFMMKLWGEILELLVGNDKELYIKWGETSTDTTTVVKRANNDNKPHTIGCKVDGRVVCQVSKVVDTCHIESARASADFGKVVSDKCKLAVESKCTIDDIVVSGKLTKKRSISMQNLQIFGLQAITCTLKFVDRGFYVNCFDYDLSFSNNLRLFADNAMLWIRRLVLFKSTCQTVASLSKQAFYKQPSSILEMFNNEEPDNSSDKYCNSTWVTGTFLPTTKEALFPKQFLTNASSRNRSSNKESLKFYLDDGTEVISVYNNTTKKKRDNGSENSSSNKKRNIEK